MDDASRDDAGQARPAEHGGSARSATPADVERVLVAAGLRRVGAIEGFNVHHGHHDVKVFWVKADRDRREHQVVTMTEILGAAGFRATTVRRDGNCYVAVGDQPGASPSWASAWLQVARADLSHPAAMPPPRGR